MQDILACIDARGNTDAVIDWTAWAAVRTGAAVEFLHVLERHPERAGNADFSGTLGLDAREALLQQLSDADATRSRGLREAGHALLAHARARAAAAGATRLDARLRHGDFVDTALELHTGAGLLVLGEHHHGGGPGRIRSDHHLERVVRGVGCPVLVATVEAFVAPQRVVFAFDGSPMALKALAALPQQPLLSGLPVEVVTVGQDSPSARQQLQEARRLLEAAGVVAKTRLLAGDPAQVLPTLVKELAPALLVIGAYGHSRLRQWLLGSTTTTLLRLSDVPVLVLR
jgi:nucleotide-binding universal stress UspA family protein